MSSSFQWQVYSVPDYPSGWIDTVQQIHPDAGRYTAQLLWQRGIRDRTYLVGFLDPAQYQPTSPWEFGDEMRWAVQRLIQALENQERVAIWGDFDADGVTATSVLWDGLGEFFPQHQRLIYYIPNRFTESHGLSRLGIEQLAQQNCHVIVTCDTGSTNQAEIEYAIALGMDVIVTDHHTLPEQRPPVTAILNPRSFLPLHPLASLSGVAVAYKLVEALYLKAPEIPQRPLADLLDLVAIGLIADLVELRGDCRYLAQLGIEQLQRNLTGQARRPGVARLLELCKRNGDRPTDISFGLGPRINAVSRVHGDARFCVELLTSQDSQRCRQLAEETELANARRKELQRTVMRQVEQQLAQIDLSTTEVVVLVGEQWPVGILGLAAGQVAQTTGKPAILLNQEALAPDNSVEESALSTPRMAWGSARSVNGIDLYELVKGQEHLLTRFGGHPFAAGLSLPVNNVPLFADSINQQLRHHPEQFKVRTVPVLQADLQVTVAELGKDLFRELKLLEPYGMGNPVPRLLITNCWFAGEGNTKIKDLRGQKLEYLKTRFTLYDDSSTVGFPGIWWDHYQDDLPPGRCDAIAELDFNAYSKKYEIRLIDVQPSRTSHTPTSSLEFNWIVDQRNGRQTIEQTVPLTSSPLSHSADPSIVITDCPSSWDDLMPWVQKAAKSQQTLAMAYAPPNLIPPNQIWQQLVGIVKYLSRTQQPILRSQLKQRFQICDRTLQLGLDTLAVAGFQVSEQDDQIQIEQTPSTAEIWATQQFEDTLQIFLAAIAEDQFQQRYFAEVPLPTIQSTAQQIALTR
ncbi:MAG: single-stranded-DNA-specific exonuclease RecJ [Thainema sp.]